MSLRMVFVGNDPTADNLPSGPSLILTGSQEDVAAAARYFGSEVAIFRKGATGGKKND